MTCHEQPPIYHLVHYDNENFVHFLETLRIFGHIANDGLLKNDRRLEEKTIALIYKIMDVHPEYRYMVQNKESLLHVFTDQQTKELLDQLDLITTKYNYERVLKKPTTSIDVHDLDIMWSLWFGSKQSKYVKKIIELSHRDERTGDLDYNYCILRSRKTLHHNQIGVNKVIPDLIKDSDLKHYENNTAWIVMNLIPFGP